MANQQIGIFPLPVQANQARFKHVVLVVFICKQLGRGIAGTALLIFAGFVHAAAHHEVGARLLSARVICASVDQDLTAVGEVGNGEDETLIAHVEDLQVDALADDDQPKGFLVLLPTCRPLLLSLLARLFLSPILLAVVGRLFVVAVQQLVLVVDRHGAVSKTQTSSLSNASDLHACICAQSARSNIDTAINDDKSYAKLLRLGFEQFIRDPFFGERLAVTK